MRYFGCISISFLFIFLIVNLKNAHADRLECKFDKYANSGYRDSIAKSWIPSMQTHEIQGEDIIHNNKNYMKGKITYNTDRKIKWSYFKDTKDSKGQLSRTTFKFIFFKTTKKVSTDVIFTGYRDIVSVWGTCEYIISSSSNNNTNSQNTEKIESNLNSKEKEIINQGFKLIRGSSGTDLFYNQETSTLLVRNNSKYYNKMHKKLIDNPNYDIRIGSFWDKERKKPKKYMFQYKKPEKIFANLNGYIREIYVQDPSVSDILSAKEKYLYVSITDYDDGMWVATRTEKSE